MIIEGIIPSIKHKRNRTSYESVWLDFEFEFERRSLQGLPYRLKSLCTIYEYFRGINEY